MLFSRKKTKLEEYTYRTQPKNYKRKKVIYWILNVLILIGIIGGYKAYADQTITENKYFDEINFFNKQYISTYMSIVENQQIQTQNKKFLSDFTAVAIENVANDTIKSLTVSSVENKSATEKNAIYETVNKVVYTAILQKNEDKVQATVYIKLKTKKYGNHQFLVLEQPSLQNYEFEKPATSEKETVKKEIDSKVVLDGESVPQEKTDMYKKNLTVFFDTYSKDVAKAKTMVNVPLSTLATDGKFETEKISFKDTQKTAQQDTLIISIPYKTPTVTFLKVYKIKYVSNSIKEFEEIQ